MSLWQSLRQPSLPPVASLSPRLDRALSITLALLGFFLPISVAGVALLLGVLLVITALSAPAVWRSAPWRDPVVASGLLLFVYIALHTLWTSGPAGESWQAINRYHELVLAAILLALFRLASRPHWFLAGLVAGTLFNACAHWVALFWQPLADYLDSRRIAAGFTMALTAFVLLTLQRQSPRGTATWLAAVFLIATVFFAIEARTGHLVMLVLTGWLAWLYSPLRWRWPAAVLLPALVLVIALGSTAVQKRVEETIAASGPTPARELNSTAIRIELTRNAVSVARQYGWTGGGFAEYLRLADESAQRLYADDPQRRAWARTPNPHNEYLMQLVGGGAAALALFLAWLVAPMLRRGRSPPAQAALSGISIAFALGCLFNSLLMDFVEGHFYVVLMTWLLARAAGGAAPAQPAAT